MLEDNPPPIRIQQQPEEYAEEPRIERAGEDTGSTRKSEILEIPDNCEVPNGTVLRELFRSPEFNRCDDLDDYAQNYNELDVIQNVITADMRHQIERVKENQAVEPIRKQPAIDVLNDESGSGSNAELPGKQSHPTSDSVEDRESTIQSSMPHQRPSVKKSAPGDGRKTMNDALDEQSSVTAKSEKPRFISWSPRECAHIRSGLKGCSRCIEACPANAVIVEGEKIKIDHYLCHGCGLCAAICPSGAMACNHFNIGELLMDLKQELKTQRTVNYRSTWVVFHGPEADPESLSALNHRMPGSIVQCQVADIAAVGLDISLPLLAYGAIRVVLMISSRAPEGLRRALNTEVNYADTILKGLNGFTGRIILMETLFSEKISESVFEQQVEDQWTGDSNGLAEFSPFQQKGALIRQSIDYLFAQCSGSPVFVALPQGAPFGEVRISKENCTLCLACAHVCPMAALTGGTHQPQLNFTEANCIQCGLCKQACPEAAITLNPRFIYDRKTAEMPRVLHRETPFVCIQCGKPFATLKMVEQIKTRLKNHWMYEKSRDIRRLEMCKDCRVADCFRHN